MSYWFDLQIDQVAGLEARIIGIAEDSTAEADGLGIGKSEDIQGVEVDVTGGG